MKFINIHIYSPPTFNFQKFGMYKAEVMEISADANNDPSDQQKYMKFKLLLDPTSNDINVYGQPAKLEVGMSVSAEIKIKEKRIIDFFLDPFRRYTSEALRERWKAMRNAKCVMRNELGMGGLI